MATMPIPVPPETEQKIIVDEVAKRLSIISEVEYEIESNMKRAEHLRQSILKQAFSGQLLRSKKLDDSELDSVVVA